MDHCFVIAVDFDGVLHRGKWPAIGDSDDRLIDALRRARQRGCRLVMNTCRVGDLLRDARNWCIDRGLLFDAINENLAERVTRFGGDCRKISADLYLDDLGVGWDSDLAAQVVDDAPY